MLGAMATDRELYRLAGVASLSAASPASCSNSPSEPQGRATSPRPSLLLPRRQVIPTRRPSPGNAYGNSLVRSQLVDLVNVDRESSSSVQPPGAVRASEVLCLVV